MAEAWTALSRRRQGGPAASRLPIGKRSGMTTAAQAASVGDEAMAHVGLRYDPVPLDVRESIRALRRFFSRRAGAVGSEQRGDHRGTERRDRIRTLRSGRSAVHRATQGNRWARRSDVRRPRPGMGARINSAVFTKQHQVDQTYANVLLNLERSQRCAPYEIHARHQRRQLLLARSRRHAGELDVVPAGLREPSRPRARHARRAPPRAALLWVYRKQSVNGAGAWPT